MCDVLTCHERMRADGYWRRYYEMNKSKIISNTQEYYRNNRSHVIEKMKAYYRMNRDKILAKRKKNDFALNNSDQKGKHNVDHDLHSD